MISLALTAAGAVLSSQTTEARAAKAKLQGYSNATSISSSAIFDEEESSSAARPRGRSRMGSGELGEFVGQIGAQVKTDAARLGGAVSSSATKVR